MTEKLLPCPFCGGQADYCETNAWWVRCNDCNAETEADMSPEAAAEIWNRRTPPPSTHVDVEEEIACVVQSVNEWDDRTSPDDYPDHLLITSEELADLLRNFAATLEGKDNG